ncbi:hypothetical protein PVAND_002533 [Polypedilum vanderplanki]|uniref:Importin N-terminal domain-containing protein n=1 Tax=Polypedilum vanderplanki TaxID=319348 RepID=A0A9J6BRP1_POLVA|nr:hypothetical protein PVAND_002533 [Polypedilum vanderplanki]
MSQQSMELLFKTLKQATNQQNQSEIKQAEANLAVFEKEPNFYTTVLDFYLNEQLDLDVRYMSLLILKQGIDKYWRKTQQNSIKPEEKILLKKKLLESFNEKIDQLAVQYAVIISKIARLDCPDDWEELMPLLLQRINTSNELEQKRSLQILVQVVKQLSTRRLHHDRKIFEQLTLNLYEFICNLWNGFTILYFQNIQTSELLPVCENNLCKSMLALKIMRKLTIHGFQKPAEAAQPLEFLKMIFERLKDLLECRLLIKSSLYITLLETHEKFILKHMKILTEFQEYHRTDFNVFAPQVLEMSFNFVFFEGTRFIFEGNQLTMPNYVISCLNLIKGFLLNNGGNVYSKSSSNETDNNLNEILKNFFTSERLEYITEKLLMHYFLLTPADLELWENDPEVFVCDEGGDSYKYSLRSCTEAFFMALFHKYSNVLCKHLNVYVQKSQSIELTSTSDAQDILIKESIYNAVGLVTFHAYDEIDFDNWFKTQLLSELQLKGENFKILRRRIIWMIGQWSAVKFSKSLRPQLYEACLELLQPVENNDMVVRLTASKTLKSVLEDFDFDAEQFLPFLEPSFTLLFHLLKEAKECDTKMNVLYVMAFIVEKMSLSIKIQAGNLVAFLPELWDEGVEHNMLRIAIISALIQIIKAIQEIPESVSPFIYKVIEISTNVNDPSTVYLLDEGLELWLITIQYAMQPNDSLLQLCNNLLPIIEKSTLNLRTCLFIMQAYIMLCPEIYLQRYGKEIVQQCQYLMKDIRTEGVVTICKLFISMLRMQPNYAIELLHPVMIDIVKNFLDDNDYLTVKQIYLQVIVRYFLANQMALNHILEEIRVENAFQKLLSIYINTMPNVTQDEDKKLLAIGLSCLLTIPNQIILDNFSIIIINIYETLCDIMKQLSEDGEEIDGLILSEHDDLPYDEIDDVEWKAPHYERYKSMCLKDCVHTVVLKEYLQNQLIALKNIVGEEQYVNLIKTIDPTIHKLLYNYVNTMVPIV